MKRKVFFIVLPIILSACSNSPLTGQSVSPSLISSSTLPLEDKITKSYNMSGMDFNNTFEIVLEKSGIEGIAGKINDKGNGLLILGAYAVKVNNFTPSNIKKLIDDDFEYRSLELDESGDGFLSWTHQSDNSIPSTIVESDNQLPNYKYKIIKNFDISDETLNTFPAQSTNNKNNPLRDNLLKTVKESDSLRIDDNGNGILIKHDTYSNFYKVSPVKNYNVVSKEYFVGPEQERLRQHPNILRPEYLKTQIDKNGNGYISWTYDYMTGSIYENKDINSEIIIKKVKNYIPVDKEISLGLDYFGYSLFLNSNGTGFVTCQKTFPSPVARVRKINNYIPEIKAYNTHSNNSQASYDYKLNILKNNFNDGLILWQQRKFDPVNPRLIIYGKAFENFNLSIQNLEEYTPITKKPLFPDNGYSFVKAQGHRSVEATSVTGIVYDKDKNILRNVDITVKSIVEESVKINPVIDNKEATYTVSGIPVGEAEVTVSKSGYKSRTRRVNVLTDREHPIMVDLINHVNFGGAKESEEEYYLEKE